MKGHCRIIFLFLLLLNAGPNARPQGYTIKVTPFCSGIYDEFSPVFYHDGIVFCSNQGNKSLVGYSDGEERLFKIFFVAKGSSSGWKPSRLLAREITSDFNDGPVTFNDSGDFMYFSRNNLVDKPFRNISDTTEKLGIYSAERANDLWGNIRPFPYNDPLYNFSMPSLAPGGSRIYFASDMPGGSGGMDLYYCERQEDEWGRPVNLGPQVNTSGNETFPFACRFSRLYFASDGHQGYGGKDLYYTQEIDGEWISPVHLDSSVNSQADDFGIVLDSTLGNGYFSSNRRNTDDIFMIRTAAMEFESCEDIRANNFCYTFYDEHYQQVDTMPVTYRWNFGDGKTYNSPEVRHCFPGPGDYTVLLDIFDETTGEPVSEQVKYDVHLENIEQAYIRSYDVGIVDQPVRFDGLSSNISEFRITGYWWNFGESFMPGGDIMNRTFSRKGEYVVQLGLAGENDSLGIPSKACTRKRIRIYNKYREWMPESGTGTGITDTGSNASEKERLSVQIRVYFMDDIADNQGSKIRETLSRAGNPVLEFDRHGILSSSYPFLEMVSKALKENPDIRLECSIRASHSAVPGRLFTAAEYWAQELAFYLKKLETDAGSYHCQGFGALSPALNPEASEKEDDEGIVELVFMKR